MRSVALVSSLPWFYFLFLLRPAAVEPGMVALCAFAGKAREVTADAAYNFLP